MQRGRQKKATKKLEEVELKSNTAVKAEIERRIQVAEKNAREAVFKLKEKLS